MKITFEMSSYLTSLTIEKYRHALSKFRLSSHHLLVEIGRHRGIERCEIKCTICNNNDIEDEYHFLLICSADHDLRKVYIKKHYYVRPNIVKYINLISTENVIEMRKMMAMFIEKAFKLRRSVINVT